MLAAAALPSRLANVVAGWGPWSSRLERALAGAFLDLSVALLVLTPLALIITLLVPLVVPAFRTSAWQRRGAAFVSVPLGFALWVFTVTAQEVKNERGSFPTLFDLGEGGTNASFLGGLVGFLGYDRIRLPALVGVLLAVAVVLLVRRGVDELVPWRRWATGVVVGFGSLFVLLGGAQRALASVNQYGPAALGDPLTGVLESAWDLLASRGPSTARDLVLTAELPATASSRGAQLLGWPPTDGGCAPARPLRFEDEPRTRDPRGTALLEALGAVSSQLFIDDARVAVFFVSLEGFRADDVHALNPAAPRQVAPFTTALYERAERRGEGVLASTKMIQAGVRTAHNLGAMTCGLGTLPYNLAFIRDLQPFQVRCLPDVLKDAGFRHAFFYGSDATFDEMHRFFELHGYEEQVSQKELPTTLPRGTWDAVTDLAVFDFAAQRVAEQLKVDGGAQFATLMSLSHHSPFTTPEDLPPAVEARVREGLETTPNHADPDDVKRLVAFSYTDAALERLVVQLETLGIAERSLVVAMADHSTGHAYVWGTESGPETDAQKAQVPFVVVVPQAFRARVRDVAAFDEALARAQRALDAAPTSLNDVPALLLALLSSHPGVAGLPEQARWHSLGGQRTSPWFDPGDGAALVSINGVSELFLVDGAGRRLGGYEDSVFLKTRADRYRVTPRLIPVTATLQEVLRCASPQPP